MFDTGRSASKSHILAEKYFGNIVMIFSSQQGCWQVTVTVSVQEFGKNEMKGLKIGRNRSAIAGGGLTHSEAAPTMPG